MTRLPLISTSAWESGVTASTSFMFTRDGNSMQSDKDMSRDDTIMRHSQVPRVRASLPKARVYPHPALDRTRPGIVGWNMHTDEWERAGPKDYERGRN